MSPVRDAHGDIVSGAGGDDETQVESIGVVRGLLCAGGRMYRFGDRISVNYNRVSVWSGALFAFSFHPLIFVLLVCVQLQ